MYFFTFWTLTELFHLPFFQKKSNITYTHFEDNINAYSIIYRRDTIPVLTAALP